MFWVLERLLGNRKKFEVPDGYVFQNTVFGTHIARGHCGMICWIPAGKSQDGKITPGFWKDLEELYAVEKDGSSRKMTEEEIFIWKKHFNNR